jgi:hypothetical protein
MKLLNINKIPKETSYDIEIDQSHCFYANGVLVHNSNASVCINSDNYWAQSRNGVITPQSDNAGFAFFAESNKDAFIGLCNQIIQKHNIDITEYTISIYGEWAGKGIQKGVGISEIDKAFFIFGVKISKPQDPEFNAYWVDCDDLSDTDVRIFNINDYPTYEIDIDFSKPGLIQNKLIELTEAVEKECPVAKTFGILGIGEGLVYSGTYKDSVYKFKVKGEKHSVTRVKTLAAVDVQKLNSVMEFVDYAVTQNRFNQAIENVFGTDELDIRRMGDLLRWIVNDIISEEIDTMSKNGLEPKDVNKYISNKTRQMFMDIYNKI